MINPETQYADLRHEPDPARHQARQSIGLLGQLADCPCLLEPYSRAPSAEEFRACLTKHLAVWRQRERKMRSDSRTRAQSAVELTAPFLWIIAAGAPTSLMTKLKVEASARWPKGVYLFGDDILRVGVVVASELPRDRTSLLVRLIAAGPLLAPAIKEVAALPPDAVERTIAEPILVEFQQRLGQSPSQDPDEQEFIVAMLKSWEETKAEGRAEGRTEGRAEGRAEGQAEGRTEAQANAVLAVLRVRGIAVTEAARARILSERDLEQLTRWHERAIVASSIAEVLDDTR